jgi:shikimate dehydrogenase
VTGAADATEPPARRAGVLGSPIAHSLSPALHRAAYAELGLAWDYRTYEVDEAALPAFLAGLDGSWAGLSLTMPLKRTVIPLLDEVSPLAVAVEAVNTVLVDGPGGAEPASTADVRLRGENTDVPGMVAALRERGVDGVAVAAVLGGGATASSAVAALCEVCTGAITVFARAAGRAEEMRMLADRLGRPVHVAPWQEAGDALKSDLVVATTPAGVTDELADAVPAGAGTLFDVVYHPWPTRIAAAWDRAGGHVVSGLDLLLHQAVLQVELMTGRWPAPLPAMRAAGEEALAARR